jgi:hypothetical protein
VAEVKRNLWIDRSKSASILATMFFGALMGTAIIFFGGSKSYPPIISTTCVMIPLMGFIICTFFLFRLKWMSSDVPRILFDVDSARPGDKITGRIELNVPRKLRIGTIVARAWGGEEVRFTESAGEGEVVYAEKAAWMDRELDLTAQGLTAALALGTLEDKSLAPGTYSYGFAFQLPLDVFPSLQGSYVKMRCVVMLRIAIIHDVDVLAESTISVKWRGRYPDTIPVDFRSEKSLGASGVPILQVSLDSMESAPGGMVKGRVTFSDFDLTRVRGTRIRLVEREWVKAQGHETVTRRVLAETTLPAPGSPLQTMQFNLSVPADAHPSITGKISKLTHFIQVRMNVAFGKDALAEENILLLPPIS